MKKASDYSVREWLALTKAEQRAILYPPGEARPPEPERVMYSEPESLEIVTPVNPHAEKKPYFQTGLEEPQPVVNLCIKCGRRLEGPWKWMTLPPAVCSSCMSVLQAS